MKMALEAVQTMSQSQRRAAQQAQHKLDYSGYFWLKPMVDGVAQQARSKELVLDALKTSHRLLIERGYVGFSLSDVARSFTATKSKRTAIHRYFDTQSLIAALMVSLQEAELCYTLRETVLLDHFETFTAGNDEAHELREKYRSIYRQHAGEK